MHDVLAGVVAAIVEVVVGVVEVVCADVVGGVDNVFEDLFLWCSFRSNTTRAKSLPWTRECHNAKSVPTGAFRSHRTIGQSA